MVLLLGVACMRPARTTPAEPASPRPPVAGLDAEAGYAGVATCGACHPAEAQIWQYSAHAEALYTLRERQRAYDPDCLRCHTTGFGWPGGFAGHELDFFLGAVGCESCHGPGGAHVAGVVGRYGRLPKDARACVGCHTPENSPDFTWEGYWPIVAHGPRWTGTAPDPTEPHP